MSKDVFSVVYDLPPLESSQTDMTEIEAAARRIASSEIEAQMLLMSLNEALRQLAEEGKKKAPGLLVTPENRSASLLQSIIAEAAAEGNAGSATIDVTKHGTKEVKFDEGDLLGWATVLFEKLTAGRKEPWREPTKVEMLEARHVALVADWGTGTYGAPIISDTLRQKGYELRIHLGDVYYSGTETEVQERFLDVWPADEGGQVSRALNSNHEMYSGGDGYFRRTLRKFEQEASYFAMANEHWLLVGLDTGYDDHALAGRQAEWLRALVNDAGGKKVILLSHHQPFSALERQGPKLVEAIGDLLGGRKIFMWIWGHEHRCVVYEQHPNWDLWGRCIGHGGMPYEREKKLPFAEYPWARNNSTWQWLTAPAGVPNGYLLDGPNPYIEDDDCGPNGYMTLEFDNERLTERLHHPDGQVAYERVFQ